MGAATVISCLAVLIAVLAASFQHQVIDSAQAALSHLYSEGAEGGDRSVVFSSDLLATTAKDTRRGFRWSDITPSKDLAFHPCFNGYDCARLEVPLDWNSTEAKPEQLALAIIRLPAKVPITDPRYGGIVLINPGGPGGSGVSLALDTGREVQTIIDGPSSALEDTNSAAQNTYHDILSWDPRGVNNTTPFATCLHSASRLLALGSYAFIPNDPATSLSYLWARQQAFAASCGVTHSLPSNDTDAKPGPHILNHATTTATVLDMVAMLEKFGAWREHQAAVLAPTDTAVRQRLAHRKGEESLNYWGISYGTLLGATFAAMQPHRIRRMVLDAVVDAENYYDGLWTSNLLDFDAEMDKFFEYCAAAGPACDLVAQAKAVGWSVKTARDLKKVWKHIQEKLPLAVPATKDGKVGPDVISQSDFKNLVQLLSYAPLIKWPKLAALIAPLVVGDGTRFAANKQGVVLDADDDDAPASDLQKEDLREKNNQEEDGKDQPCPGAIDPHNPDCALAYSPLNSAFGSLAILCSDGDADTLIHRSPESFRAFVAILHSQSAEVGDAWAAHFLGCAGWPGRAGWKWTDDGEMDSKTGRRRRREIASNATAHGILWVGNALDNATPCRGAEMMARKFRGSRSVRVEIEGHGLLANPSLRAGRAVRAYFQTGALPAEGTSYLPHKRPFLGADGPNVERLPDVLDGSDREMLEAMYQALEGFYGAR